MLENTKLFLSLDASQVDIKQLLKKDFLELSIRAISSANPNLNNTWFTRESMEASLDSFINKPILGYFENGDFVSHNGNWDYDSETEMSYWNTLGKQGERILGMIRESDEVKIIKGQDGLDWVTFSCALWVQYSFKQVKRLLKDAKRAQKNGGPTKNISVEVDLLDYEEMDNGVVKINKFSLVGVTILGSRNGVKVEPGIENAELSVVDIMGKDVYEKQTKALRLAYEKLGSNSVTEDNKKEEKTPVIIENQKQIDTNLATACASDTDGDAATAYAANSDTNNEDTCPECGENPCVCENKTCDNGKTCAENNGDNNDSSTNSSNDDDDDDDNDDDSGEPNKNDCSDTNDGDSSGHTDNFANCGCGCVCGESEPVNPVKDLLWIAERNIWDVEDLERSIEYYNTADGIPYKEYIVSVFNRMIAARKQFLVELTQLIAKVAENSISEDDINYEAKLTQYTGVDLIQKYEDEHNLVDQKEKLIAQQSLKLSEYAHKEFLQKADSLISSAKLPDEIAQKFFEDCKSGVIADIDELKMQVALSAFEETSKNNKTVESFSAPVSEPDVDSAFTSSTRNKKTYTRDSWSVLQDYIGK